MFRLCCPDRGDFVAFVSNLDSRRVLRRAVELFRTHSDFPVEYLTAPSLVPGVSWSDHRSFWRQGYHALMVTDTALYRYPHYHTPEDTPDKHDYDSLGRIIEGLAAAWPGSPTECGAPDMAGVAGRCLASAPARHEGLAIRRELAQGRPEPRSSARTVGRPM